MARDPLLSVRVTITAKDINGNNVAKTFTNVKYINWDFNDATINIVDVTGSFYFPILPVTTVTTTVNGSVYNITIS